MSSALLSYFSEMIDWIQNRLNFKHWEGYHQFTSDHGLGRVAFISFSLASILWMHVMALTLICMDRSGLISVSFFSEISSQRMLLLIQWTLYVIAITSFHLSEFFVTAIFNPSVVTASSFVVNHSKTYTIAMLLSMSEFLVRLAFFPNSSSKVVMGIGLVMAFLSQCTRSIAMITCGSNFNHFIQQEKKKNHRLVTYGIYKYLRHPSYFGFYYWSIGTQLLLCNFLSASAFAAASWFFFNRRIPYEEQILLRLFPSEYPEYMSKSYIGIPMIKTAKLSDKSS